jgi:GNAT superfamily N-acetyltransferase
MRAPVASRSQTSEVRDQKFEVRELRQSDWKFNRDMYFKVGENWKWIDRKPWTDEQWEEYASDPKLRTFAGYYEDKLAGYYELRRESEVRAALALDGRNASIEIAYFGLLSEFIGRGLGGALLNSAIENAWNWLPAPSRIWVHTCNRDHPQALANYQARGMTIYKVEEEKN